MQPWHRENGEDMVHSVTAHANQGGVLRRSAEWMVLERAIQSYITYSYASWWLDSSTVGDHDRVINKTGIKQI